MIRIFSSLNAVFIHETYIQSIFFSFSLSETCIVVWVLAYEANIYLNIWQYLFLRKCCFLQSGRKSFLKAPKKLVTGVAYPFALIKPCGAQGDVTLKDINQRIHSPPSSTSKQKLDEDPSTSYPTSAFSGKPVVLKTKIHTKGGRGSITIMRTKGWLDKYIFFFSPPFFGGNLLGLASLSCISFHVCVAW